MLFVASLFILPLSCTQSKEKEEQILILAIDTINYPGDYESYMYVNQHGDTIVPVGRYSICFTDTIRKVGFVFKPSEGFISIDNYGNEWYKIYDYERFVAEGCFVITNDNRTKYGYATMEGEVIVEPKYSNCGGFSEGLANVAIDTKLAKVNWDGECYEIPVGGKWGFINKQGEEVIPLMYDSLDYPHKFVDGKVRVLKDGEWFYIDKNNNRLPD